jgi:hypothetical protein
MQGTVVIKSGNGSFKCYLYNVHFRSYGFVADYKETKNGKIYPGVFFWKDVLKINVEKA